MLVVAVLLTILVTGSSFWCTIARQPPQWPIVSRPPLSPQAEYARYDRADKKQLTTRPTANGYGSVPGFTGEGGREAAIRIAISQASPLQSQSAHQIS